MSLLCWSCEGVDYNQWLSLQYNLCMNINDVYFGESIFFLCSCKNGHCAKIDHSV